MSDTDRDLLPEGLEDRLPQQRGGGYARHARGARCRWTLMAMTGCSRR